MMGCDGPPTALSPCRGFTGDCSELASQFETVEGSPFYPPGSYSCAQACASPADLRVAQDTDAIERGINADSGHGVAIMG